MLSVKNETHPGAFSLHANQIGDLFKPESRVPVVANSLGTTDKFNTHLSQTLTEREDLSENCLARRDDISVERAIDRLADCYQSLL